MLTSICTDESLLRFADCHLEVIDLSHVIIDVRYELALLS